MLAPFKKSTKVFPILILLLSQQVFCGAQMTASKIETLISKMTLEEKVGQMTNITIGMVAKETPNGIVIDQEKLKDVLINHKV